MQGAYEGVLLRTHLLVSEPSKRFEPLAWLGCGLPYRNDVGFPQFTLFSPFDYSNGLPLTATRSTAELPRNI